MAAKLKKRLSKTENKLLELEKLELKDVVCSICQSILIEPVTLPCFHSFCCRCFNGSIENNALCCPLCRLRIGSWLRSATKQKNLVNVQLWDFMKSKFSQDIAVKLKGDDVVLPEETTIRRLSAPGEIRFEYEAELQRLRAERSQLELKQFHETELLIKKIQEEEREAQRKYLERLKEDELLAQQIQNEHLKDTIPPIAPRKQIWRRSVPKPRLKATKIESYLSKTHTHPKDSPLLTDDNTSTDSSASQIATTVLNNTASPEMVPSYGKTIKNFMNKTNKSGTGLWNKENGEKDKNEDLLSLSQKKVDDENNIKEKSKNVTKLLVSLPLPSSGVLLQHKPKAIENRNLETGSVDSMRQELCYFKPIDKTRRTSFKKKRCLPVRVPCVRPDEARLPPPPGPAPTRAQYLEELCRLRQLSLASSLPSAFVIALDVLKVKKEGVNTRAMLKKNAVDEKTSPIKSSASYKKKPSSQVDGIIKLNIEPTLRRTRSMGSISRNENESTPKKGKIIEGKASSERKPYLRSDSKKQLNTRLSSPPLITKTINNDKINLAVKNLSSPLKNCDMKKILQEQLRIEKIIELEKSDLEMARKIDAEWNGRRQAQRSAVKRQVTLYGLKSAKKLKV